MNIEWGSALLGFTAGLVLAAVFVTIMVRNAKSSRTFSSAKLSNNAGKIAGAFIAALMGVISFIPHMAAHADTPVPVPTLNIPVSTLFEQTNFWMGTFAPVVAIGVGITIALAILGYVGLMISGAFRGTR